MAKELATQLIEQLQAAGVQRIYGIVGDSLNPSSMLSGRPAAPPKGVSIGSTSGMKKLPRSPQRPKRNSPESWPCVPVPAAPATST